MNVLAQFGLIGRLVAQTGHRDALVAHLREGAELMESAPGCELYAVGIGETGDDVWVTEIWTSREDHASSLSLPGVKDLIGRARPLIAAMEQVAELQVAAVAGHHRVNRVEAADDR